MMTLSCGGHCLEIYIPDLLYGVKIYLRCDDVGYAKQLQQLLAVSIHFTGGGIGTACCARLQETCRYHSYIAFVHSNSFTNSIHV